MNTCKFFLVLLFLFFSIHLIAQPLNTFSIITPEEIAGDFGILKADFGPEIIQDVAGNVVTAMDDISPMSDACTDIVNDLSGSIVLIDRGTCAFDEKVFHAQEQGAIAAIICNNLPGDLLEMQGQDFESMITIYAAMAEKEACDRIKVALESGTVEGILSFSVPPCEVSYDSTYVWGTGPEGTFENCLGDWATIGISDKNHIFQYAPMGVGQGELTPSLHPIKSPTACNGAAIMDFDFLTTDTLSVLLSELDSLPKYTAALISPRIDLSTVRNSIVEFYYFYAPINGKMTFSYSIDDGETWMDEMELSPTTDIFLPIPFTAHINLPIPLLDEEENVRLKFDAHQCDFYVFTLDDVAIKGERFETTIVTSDYFQDSEFKVFPNPTRNNLQVQFNQDLNAENLLVQMYDSQGRKVYSKNFNIGKNRTLQIETSNLLTGIYHLVVESKEQIYQQSVSVK